MKKNVKSLNPLTLSKETLRNLELPKNAVVGRLPPPDTEEDCDDGRADLRGVM